MSENSASSSSFKRVYSDSFFERFYHLSENGTDVKTEIIAGITTFITMAYALIIIPSFLADAGIPPKGLYTSVCLIAIIGTMLHAFYSKLPFGTSPGLGLTIFFAYKVCAPVAQGGFGYTWQQGLAAVAISGMLFVIITLTPLRKIIIEALPNCVKIAITGGIGLFISLIGFKNAGIVVAAESGMHFGNLRDPAVLLSILGLFLILIFMAKGIKAAILISIAIVTLVGIPLGVTDLSGFQAFSLPPSIKDTLFKQDFVGLLGGGGAGKAILNVGMIVLTISMVDLFDNIGTMLAVAQKGNLYDENGDVKNFKKALLTDAIATTISSFFGSTTTSTYLEVSSGIAAGGRTGLAALATGVMFIIALFFSGIVGIVPGAATAPALIVIGVLMIGAVTKLDFDDITEAGPSFFTIALMPFTGSIAEGIAVGIISYVILKLATGRHKEIKPAMYVLSMLFIIRFAIM